MLGRWIARPARAGQHRHLPPADAGAGRRRRAGRGRGSGLHMHRPRGTPRSPAGGTNRLGQLGEGTTGSGREWPARVPRLFDIVAISAGEDHVCAIHRDGELSCWGLGVRHQANQRGHPEGRDLGLDGRDRHLHHHRRRPGLLLGLRRNHNFEHDPDRQRPRRGEGLGGQRQRLRASPQRRRVVLGTQRRGPGRRRQHHPPVGAGAAHVHYRCGGHKRQLGINDSGSPRLRPAPQRNGLLLGKQPGSDSSRTARSQTG